MRPVHAAACGSHTSNLISESDDGRAVPCTRHIGTVTFWPEITAGGVTTAADVIVVVASGETPVRLPHGIAACAAPDAAAKHNATASLRVAPPPPLPCFLMACMTSPLVGFCR